MLNEQGEDKQTDKLISIINRLLVVIVVLVLSLIALPLIFYYDKQTDHANEKTKGSDTAVVEKKDAVAYWTAPDLNIITDAGQKEMAEYGKDLIAHTSKYLGPKGSVMQISNGMNCQNCHLRAGTTVFGNNYGSVASLYPKFRARSGTVENIYKRVNDCFERSLNGKSLDTTGKEMQAIKTYINFIGSNVPRS